jgi:hypothetical protein
MAESLLTSEGFIGAVVGAGLTYFTTVINEWYKGRKQTGDIKKLIETDLVYQAAELNVLLKEILYAKDVLKGIQDDNPDFKLWYLNDSVFKSNTFIEYHKAYTEQQFHNLVKIYQNIEALMKFSSNAFLNDYYAGLQTINSKADKYEGELKKFKDITLINLTMKQVVCMNTFIDIKGFLSGKNREEIFNYFRSLNKEQKEEYFPGFIDVVERYMETVSENKN